MSFVFACSPIRMLNLRRPRLQLFIALLSVAFTLLPVHAQRADAASSLSQSSAVPSRVLIPVNSESLVQLRGNTPPAARAQFDQGGVDLQLPMNRVVLVLRRSPEQEAALGKLMAEQQDPHSPNYHHWLSPEQFGTLYGPSDRDMAAITAWLQNQGFRIDHVSKGRVTIEFSGTAGQVNHAFHTEIHRYMVKGIEHTSNDRDPQIPEALAPVITGIASLHNFFPVHQSIKGGMVRRDKKTGKLTPVSSTATGTLPQFTYTDDDGNTREDITPYDFATIYNVLPLWKAGIDGTGETIAISGASDITLSDVAAFQSSFGLANHPPTIIHNGTDPGEVSGAQGENTLDVEWSGAVAPKATIALVVSGSTQTTFGGQLSNAYIVDNKIAPVMSASYGECELYLGSAGNAAYNSIWQQGAAEGISIFESAGDQGSAGCESQDVQAPNAAKTGLQVNGLASSPYVTAVGGTDFLWQNNPISTYWNASNATNGSTAKGYIPEIPWNSTCSSTYLVSLSIDANGAAFCNDVYHGTNYAGLSDLVVIGAGSGGVSACTTPSGTTPSTCGGGYAKPSWQTGVGVPSDGKRDLPDVSLFASDGFPDGLNGSAYLFCDSSGAPGGSCNYSDPNDIVYQEVGGTSVSSPAMAGIMALVVQNAKSAQGLANPMLYKLAASENLATCNSNTVTNVNSCIFYDTTSGLNGQVCENGTQDCVVNKSSDQLGVLSGYSTTKGYDLATGLGSVNAANLVNGWNASTGAPVASVSPSGLTFSATQVHVTSAAQIVTLKNTGNALLNLSTATITGAGASSFSDSTTCGSSLAAGASCTFSLSFDPTTTGTLTASFNVPTNASGSPAVVSLSGTGTAAISATTLTLTPSSSQVTYGQAVNVLASLSGSPAPTGTISYAVDGGSAQSATLSGGSVSLSLGILAAGGHTVAATYSGGSSYQATSQSVTFSIAKAVLTAAAANLSRVYGATNPPLTYAVTGFVHGDTSAVISGTASLATTATSNSAVGSYPITFATKSLSASNYTFTYVAGTLTVSGGASQTIFFGALAAQVYGASPLTLTATASSGLPVTYAVTGPAAVSGSRLSITGAGSVTVTASQAGNATYAAAPSVSQSFTVGRATLTVMAASVSRQYGAANPTLTYSIAGFVNGDTSAAISGAATLSTTASSTSPAGMYPITFATEGLAASNYTFTYVAGTLTVTATGSVAPPSFSPAGGTFPSAQLVGLSDASAGATLYYTTNGSMPGVGSTIYTAPIEVATSETINAVAILNGVASTVASATYTISMAQCTTINYANGFTSAGLSLNGGATVKNGTLQLTDGGTNEARSAFYATLVPVSSYTTDFTFQLTNPAADGFTFVIQANTPQALGASGGGLGYAGIVKSAAIKFDLYNNSGEGSDSTGVYLNGAAPTNPSVNLTPAGIDLHSGHIFAVHIRYANASAMASITDTVTHATASATMPGDLTQVVGGSAYIGFTGGTGGQTATQNVLTWSYSAGPGCSAR